MTWLYFMLYFSKTARNLFIILSLHKVDNISFQMSLSSHLAALVWQTGVHTHIARSKEVIWRDLVRWGHDTTYFDVIFLKNGSKLFHNTFPAQSRQYFLSNEPGQPFGGCVNMVVQEYILISMFPSTPYAQSAGAEWLRGIKWKAILFSICWWNIFHF